MSESPIQRVGGEYDGASANGWHVMIRWDDGSLESLAGPFPTNAEACVELARWLAMGRE